MSGEALLVVDLQRDFLHPEGAYARGGVAAPAAAGLPARLGAVADAARGAGVPVVASLFTLVPGPDGEPLVSGHLRRVRPFLARGDFAPGSWGQGTVDELGTPDATVEKVAFSAFLHTRLEWLARRLDVDRFVVGGIVTDGGVASTVRDAHARDFGVTLLTDGCASFSTERHDATIVALGGVATMSTCADEIRRWSGS